jgi:hypothetical protein
MLGLLIAERIFQIATDGAPIVLRIGMPRPHPKGDWTCPFQIVGGDNDTVREAPGVDALQALMQCIDIARHELQTRSGPRELRWLGLKDLGLSSRELPAPIVPPAPLVTTPPPAISEKAPPPVRAEPVAKKPDRPSKPTAKSKAKIAVVKTVTPDDALRAVVGDGPMLRKDVTKKFWAYVKRHALQDRLHKRTINADEKLRAVFGGRSQVEMADVEKLIDKHVKSQSSR